MCVSCACFNFGVLTCVTWVFCQRVYIILTPVGKSLLKFDRFRTSDISFREKVAAGMPTAPSGEGHESREESVSVCAVFPCVWSFRLSRGHGGREDR